MVKSVATNRAMLLWVLLLVPDCTHPRLTSPCLHSDAPPPRPHLTLPHPPLPQTRDYPRSEEGKRRAIRYGGWDSNLSLLLAFFVNAAILVVSGAAFHGPDRPSVSGITDAYQLLDPALGSRVASTVFAVALLASGQNSTITGTLSGQIVMEGFTSYQVKPWIRRLATRMLAVVPAALVAALAGPSGINTMLGET